MSEAGSISSFHIGVAAEAIAAAQFARLGYDVSVQYGANQPEYDLVVVRGDRLLKVSVKGSQKGAWGLTQSLKKGRSYHEAADEWLKRHKVGTIFCLVQFKGVPLDRMPRVYVATPSEIAQRLKDTRGGHGETILYEDHTWVRGVAKGLSDRLPEAWRLSHDQMAELFRIA
ncbi:MAG: hypothetical protein O2992_12675 [Gemmatimonadetes bacterium]|nr:hypothetical protein [Gemmatimonadota bacterium]